VEPARLIRFIVLFMLGSIAIAGVAGVLSGRSRHRRSWGRFALLLFGAVTIANATMLWGVDRVRAREEARAGVQEPYRMGVVKIASTGIVVAIPAVLLGLLGRRISRRRPYSPDSCPHCGYNLSGGPHKRCPECGEFVPAADSSAP
jgi:hypothetical protein